MTYSVVALCSLVLLLLSSHCTYGLEYSRQQQRYNPTSDFLQHEAGLVTNAGKNDPFNNAKENPVLNNGRRDYVANNNPQPNTNPTNGLQSAQNSGKRDFVAPSPQSPTPVTPKHTTGTVITQTSGGKRDFVSSQFPTLRPIHGSSVTQKTPTTASLSIQALGGKRDYVAPQYPTLKPVQGTNQPGSGNVKDLINFYDNKDKQNTPQRVPSYSSILQGSTNKNTPGSTSTTAFLTQTTPIIPPKPKPLSFSNVVSGSRNNAQTTVGSTSKSPNTALSSYPTSKPNTVLPSSIVNKNKNTQTISTGPATDLELQTLSEELLRKDVNNPAKYVTINYQGKTTSQSKDDKAPQKLLTISPETWNIPTIQKFVPLLDNYERDTLVNEYVTPQERIEEIAFLDEIMSTSVIRHLMNFLKAKGYVSPDPTKQKEFLKQLWFTLYSRGKGKISSSAFEHVFVSEVRNGEVLGLHNWIYFSKEESANRINYLGYLKYLQLSDKGAIMKFHFNQQGSDKPVASMFVGTSPELEMALYTLCFVTRPDNDCKLKLANNDVDIITHTFRYRSKNLIGSAYPQIPSNYNNY